MDNRTSKIVLQLQLIIFIMAMVISLIADAQEVYRDALANDSTFYVLNSDTTIIAGKQKLYISTSSGVALLQDFTTSGAFIRDFDMVTDDKWYAIVSDPGYLVAFPGVLFKSLDKGQTWVTDTSFYSVSRYANLVDHRSVNQINRISEDTIVLFMGYYQCAILYSTDGGDSWDNWFSNYFANYQGLLECGDDYYLWGLQGDGFPASMFKIPGHLMFSPDTNNVWRNFAGKYHPDCHNGVNPDCTFGLNPSPVPFYLDFLHFKNIRDSLCLGTTTSMPTTERELNFSVSPNPSSDGTFLITSAERKPYSIKVFSTQGQLLHAYQTINDDDFRINLSKQSKGLYFLIIQIGDKIVTEKLIY